MMNFPLAPGTAAEAELRAEVRSFLNETLTLDHRRALGQAGLGHSPEFSKALATRGWVGMSMPVSYGGSGAGAVERFVVTEELLAAGAPVSAHWVADRQSAPSLLMHGTQDQRERLIPQIVNAEAFWAIGMSEPGSGSDLASVRTRARQVPGGWEVSGQKVWTTWAHLCDYFAVLCRTADLVGNDRHGGLSQLIVELRSPGVTVRPITTMDGEIDFCEVVLDAVFVPDSMVLGEAGDGWNQVTGELALERYGAERWMSSWGVFVAAVDVLAAAGRTDAAPALGRMLARYRVLREMSLAVARSVDAGARPEVEAAVVKDLGTTFEQDVVEGVRDLLDLELDPGDRGQLEDLLSRALLSAPIFTIRGGTTEVLRSILANRLRR